MMIKLDIRDTEIIIYLQRLILFSEKGLYSILNNSAS